MMNKSILSNQIHAEMEGVAETGFPLSVFPDAIQSIVHELVTYENFNLEFTSTIILSVFSTATGNTFRIRIKGNWITNCALYMILVGRPGLGKTPPLGYLYTPIRDKDQQMLEKARRENNRYVEQQAAKKDEAADDKMEKPHLIQTIISDFTQEAMVSIHYDNPHGIVLLVDEVVALFNSVKRYSAKSNLIEDLLSAYSGQPLKAVRKTEAFPLSIPQPCINLIGGIQTDMLDEVFKKEYMANGLLDRFLFTFPKNKKIPKWQIGIDKLHRPDTMKKWQHYINKVLELSFPVKDDGVVAEPKVLEMTDEAMRFFYEWNNGIIDKVNAIEDDNDVESRVMKLNGNAARLALILQVMRWSAGEGPIDRIDLESVKGAISLIGYFEESYRRVKAAFDHTVKASGGTGWLELVDDTFTSAEAELAGEKMNISRRTIYDSLKKLCEGNSPVLKRVKQGVYQKIVNQGTTALCTTAQEPSAEEEKVQSAEVQSANQIKKGDSNE